MKGLKENRDKLLNDFTKRNIDENSGCNEEGSETLNNPVGNNGRKPQQYNK